MRRVFITITIAMAILLSVNGLAQNRAVLLHESFDGNSIPAGWSTMGEGGNNWVASRTNNALDHANRTLVANFTLQSFTITATVDPVEAATVSGAGTYDYGETVTLSFERNEDYAFRNWTENGFVVC